jgi:methylase of polypeptide subunit release factors
VVAGAGEPSTWGAQIDRAERTLAAAGSPAPREEAVELLGVVLGVPRPAVLAQMASPLRRSEEVTYADWIARRARGEALSHITGHQEFMGLDLLVGHDDPLVPPHARRLVELALESCRRHLAGELVAVEIGTGCGAVALALAALEPRFVRIYAMDAPPAALDTARANGARYLMNLVIRWTEGEQLDAIPEPVDVIVCDWVAHGRREISAEALGAEGAGDGDEMNATAARVFQQARGRLRPGGTLIGALPRGRRPAITGWLARALPEAQIGWELPVDDVVIAVALLPRGEQDKGVFPDQEAIP